MSYPDRKMPSTDARIGNYLLVMSGSIQSAPFLSCWKDLKDHIRKHIRRPGHTYVSSASEAGIHRGWCNFRREDDAKAAYGMRLLVSTTRKAVINATCTQNITSRCPRWGFVFSKEHNVVPTTYYTTIAAFHHLLPPNVATHLVVLGEMLTVYPIILHSSLARVLECLRLHAKINWHHKRTTSS
jgi:hypothetical protein